MSMITNILGSYGVGAAYAVLAALSFALWNIFMQRAFDRGHRSNVLFAVVNITVAGLFVPVVLTLAWRGALPPIDPRGMLFFTLAGMMTGAVGPFHSAHATRRIGVTYTTSLRLLDPFFAFVIAFIALGERVTGRVATGVALVVGALLLLQFDRRRKAAAADESAHTLQGVGFGIAASISFTIGSTARKAGLLLAPSAFLAAAMEGIVGLATVLPSLRTREDWRSLRAAFGPGTADMWLSGLTTAAGTLCLNLALQSLPVPVAVALRNTSPWFALLLVPLLLGGTLRPGRWIWASTALLTAGMLLIVFR